MDSIWFYHGESGESPLNSPPFGRRFFELLFCWWWQCKLFGEKSKLFGEDIKVIWGRYWGFLHCTLYLDLLKLAAPQMKELKLAKAYQMKSEQLMLKLNSPMKRTSFYHSKMNMSVWEKTPPLPRPSIPSTAGLAWNSCKAAVKLASCQRGANS